MRKPYFRALAVVAGPVLAAATLVSDPAGGNATGAPDIHGRPQLVAGYGKLPLSFEPNQGQAGPEVRYLSRGRGYSLALEADSALLRVRGAESPDGVDSLRLSLAGAAAEPVLSAEKPLPGKSHYLAGNDPAKHHRNIPHYGAVRYREVYPGIDWVMYGNPQMLEYDFLVQPGADPTQIRLRYAGAESLALNPQGDLVLKLGAGEVIQKKPVVYQDIDGERRSVEGRYRIEADRQVAFELSSYDRDQPLVIDPVLVYSTYLGGSRADVGNAVAVDSTGSAYVSGYTFSSDLDKVNPIEGHNGNYDAFVTKLSPDGTSLVYSTYLGGSGSDYVIGMTVDGAGSAYIAGGTESTDFNTVNPAQSDSPGTDAFVAKLSADGASLVYSTYLGGNQGDIAWAVAVDASGNAYVTGYSDSTDFQTVNPIEGHNPGASARDVFILKLNPAGNSLVYSTYLGGSDQDHAYDIVVDNTGSAYVAGFTYSTDFNTVDPIEGYNPGGNRDAFVAKVSPAGNSLTYSTYLGGTGGDAAFGIAIDSAGSAYVTGGTDSSDFNTLNPVEGRDPVRYSDAFIAKLSPEGSSLVYSTYLGGNGFEEAYGIAVDSGGNAYATGFTRSTDFNTVNFIEKNSDGNNHPTQSFADAFVAKLGPTGNTLIYSTYLGGSSTDVANAVVVDSAGNAYVSGYTYSTDFSTVNPFEVSSANAFTGDAFIAKLDNSGAGCGLVAFDALEFQRLVETDGMVSVIVRHKSGSAGPGSVQYATADGTAVAGQDYIATAGTLTWANGDSTSRTIDIPVLDDSVAEPTQAFTLNLSNVSCGNLGWPNSRLIRIADDDAGVRVNPAWTSVAEGGTAVVTVQRLPGNTTGALSVDYATEDAKAKAAEGDYTPVSGTLQWAAGETANKTININTANDSLGEIDEAFKLTLSNPVGGTIGGYSPSASVGIVDNDPGLQITATQIQAVEGGMAVVTVRRLPGHTSGAISVQYATGNGSARSPGDYTATSGVLSWAPNEVADKTVSIAIVSDATAEASENFRLTLSNALGGTVYGSASAYITIQD